METIFMNPDHTMDRRKKKTKIAIHNALLELLKTKEVTEITVLELAELADINRKTFYNNYDSIDAVVQEMYDNFFQYIFSHLPENITLKNKIEIYHLLNNLNHSLEPYKEVLRQLKQMKNKNPIDEHIKGHLMPYIHRSLSYYNVNEKIIPFIGNFIIYGLSGIYLSWAENDDLNAEQVSMLGYNLVISALKPDNFVDIIVGE